MHAARRSLPSSRAGAVSCKKQLLAVLKQSTCICTYRAPLRRPPSPSLSLFFVLSIPLLLCPSFILSPSSCLTLDRFLPLYASSLLDNHNPCSSSSRYSLLRQQLWVERQRREHSLWKPKTNRNQPSSITSRPLWLFEISVAVR